ncbi:MAG: ABC transporter substrate-binding protein [Caldithrix sp.]|nr:ABC transporter substrate-binding protein [Caldithrix sp.]
MMPTKRLPIILFILLLMTISVNAQKADKNQWKIFQQSKELYLKGDFKRAKTFFEAFIKKFPDSRLLTATQLMLAKSEYKLQNYRQSLKLCQSFVKRFSQSTYVDDIYYLKAKNYYRLKRYETAVSTWLYIADEFRNTPLGNKSLRLAESAIKNNLDEQAMLHLEEELESDFARRVILYQLTRYYQQQNLTPVALPFLERYLNNSSAGDLYYNEMKRLYDITKGKAASAIRIAALLPLSGMNETIGTSLLQGAQLATEKFNQQHDINIEIVPYDYETRLITAIRKFKEIARNRSIAAVFGPVENDITAACASIADYEKVPIITPTASSKELRSYFDHVVQLTTPVDVVGNKLATFSRDSLNMQRIVTLAPLEDYYLNMTDAYVNTFTENGGKVISQEWYYSGENDFSKQLNTLKRIGLKLAYQDSVLNNDSLDVQLSQVDSLYQIHLDNERTKLSENGTKLDSADIPVTSLDGIFMPIYKADINLIAPQFAYANIQATLLGNSDWYDEDALNKNKHYVDSLVFATNGYLNKENWDYKKFRNNFRKKFQTTPDMYALIAYDSFDFIGHNFTGGGNSQIHRGNFLSHITTSDAFQGIYRTFNISESRYNKALRILQYFKFQGIFPLR